MHKGFIVLSATSTLFFAAFSSSSSYQLQNYGLGAGGTNSASSTSYKLNASSGEVTGDQATGTGVSDRAGSTNVRQANTPLAPTLNNGSNTYYNKLQFIIVTSGSDASDYTYSIATSTNSFATTLYVQADGTLGATAVYQTYASWGGASGSYMIGLTPATTYQVKVNAMQANFTTSAYGPVSSAVTANPSLTFSISPNNVSLGNLSPGSVISGTSDLTFSFATNGGSGGAVYIAGANAGLRSTSNSYTIAALTGDLSAQTEGFGVRGLTATQTSGGPLTINSPFNAAGSNVGTESTAFRQLFSSTAATIGGSGTASIKGKAAVNTPVGTDYTETLTFIASASF